MTDFPPSTESWCSSTRSQPTSFGLRSWRRPMQSEWCLASELSERTVLKQHDVRPVCDSIVPSSVSQESRGFTALMEM